MTQVANFATGTAGFVDTAVQFATNINDAVGKFAAGVIVDK
jgi:hypothetical protein